MAGSDSSQPTENPASFSINSLASAFEALLAESGPPAPEPESLFATSEATAPSQSDSLDFDFGLELDSDAEIIETAEIDDIEMGGEAALASEFESLFENFALSAPPLGDPEPPVEPEISPLALDSLFPDEAASAPEQPADPTPEPLTAEIDLSLLDQFAAPADLTLESPTQTSDSLSLDNFELGTATPDSLMAEPDAASSASSPSAFAVEDWFRELDSSSQPVPDVQPDNGLDSLLIGFDVAPDEPDSDSLEGDSIAEPTPLAPEPAEPLTAADLFQFDLVTEEPARPEPVDPEPENSEPSGEAADLPADSSEPLASEQLNDLFIPDQFSDQFPDQFDTLTGLEIDLESLEAISEDSASLDRANPDSDADLGLDLELDFGQDASPADADWLALEQLGAELPASEPAETLLAETLLAETFLPEIAAPEPAAEASISDLLGELELPEPLELSESTGFEPAGLELTEPELTGLELIEASADPVSDALPDLPDSAPASPVVAAQEFDNPGLTEPAPVDSASETGLTAETELAADPDPIDIAPIDISDISIPELPELPELPDATQLAAIAPADFPTPLAEPALPDLVSEIAPTEAPAEPETRPAIEPVEFSEAAAPEAVIQPLDEAPTVSAIAEATPDLQTLTIEVVPAVLGSSGDETRGDQTSAEAESGLDDSTLAQLDQLLAPPEPGFTSERNTSPWCLGIDIGTTGLSAVLLNQAECQLYPIYWQTVQPAEAEPTAKKQFRLSTSVALSASEATEPTASPLPTLQLAPAAPTSAEFYLSDWKPFLKIALPHHSPQTSQWEPVLQWTTEQTLPLRTLQEVLQELLLTLNPARTSALPFTCGALGLEAEQLAAILQNLNTVVLGYPNSWLEAYSFNLREAVLQAELVSQPSRVVFVEEATAALLSALPATDGRPLLLSSGQGQSGHVQNASWQGMTLILTAGASVTELVLVNLPPQHQQLNATDFYVRSLPYAGQGLDQDILSQILYPALVRAAQVSELEAGVAAELPAAPKPEASPDFSLPLIDIETLDSLVGFSSLPAAAELALVKRHQLQQRLLSSPLGHQLLAAAHALKITLQYQGQFRLQSGEQLLVLERQDLTSQVFLPYVQRLNRELNTLLAQTNTTATAIQQVICTGGTAAASVMTRWLRQKLPNATIVQDTYARPASPSDRQISSCSRIAYGLATLPLHAQVIDESRHRYSDYYLLAELLRTLPQQPLRVGAIMDLLEQRGIDTQTCRFRILALLDGHLPAGLVPDAADVPLLKPESAANPDYQAIRLAPLLHKPADRTYEPNRAQWAYLQYYLETLLVDTEQTLGEPLNLELGAEVE
ncbi:MAG: hypothetical protein ACKO7W_05770 [Elainella sp.]